MKEFISILISFIFMGVAESIDSAFNNAISIDSIVVCGSLFSIDLINFVDFYIRSVIYKVELEKYNALLKENGKSFI